MKRKVSRRWPMPEFGCRNKGKTKVEVVPVLN
jgi:hypothetical protein